ncbi:MAG: type II secretion system protein F [Actinobacteria bacterium]|uniref:Unannotated protein n=1 Tax=freshwater metagenome TaxID=449393 RepID=A0A6J6X8S5_9ZZZZ|nr:type II secretion system protein F [Actinomycetota bacterium]
MNREILISFTTLLLIGGFYLIYNSKSSSTDVVLGMKRKIVARAFPFIIVFIFGYLAIYTIIKSMEISIAVSILFLFIPYLQERSLARKRARNIRSAWPEMIDQLVTGIQSGVSLSEALLTLKTRGPIPLRPFIEIVSKSLLDGENFEIAMRKLKTACNLAESDQIVETLILAKTLGSKDIGIVLRTLSQFLREDLAIRIEIEAKHSWIKNSAVLAGVAPWILLLILSTQPETIAAYSTSVGLSILLAGVLLTVIAFFWMEKVGALPIRRRVLEKRILVGSEA